MQFTNTNAIIKPYFIQAINYNNLKHVSLYRSIQFIATCKYILLTIRITWSLSNEPAIVLY